MKGCDGCNGKIPLFLEQELQDQELVNNAKILRGLLCCLKIASLLRR